ncbi:hypothetical protein [Paenibacillus odorifer]|uniref:hypothetical protein n=1 Tax=Paenibacillus odorifer TaxID=189426 RepID=UPI0015C37907|nr:hypothetical protein [Paenibacillus odorifer]
MTEEQANTMIDLLWRIVGKLENIESAAEKNYKIASELEELKYAVNRIKDNMN